MSWQKEVEDLIWDYEIGITSPMKGLHVPHNNLHFLCPLKCQPTPFFTPCLAISYWPNMIHTTTYKDTSMCILKRLCSDLLLCWLDSLQIWCSSWLHCDIICPRKEKKNWTTSMQSTRLSSVIVKSKVSQNRLKKSGNVVLKSRLHLTKNRRRL